EVEIVAPGHPAGARWRVATTLPRDGAPPLGFGRYRASSYDELLDHPVEMADFRHVAFEAGGATHDVAVSGRAAVGAPPLGSGPHRPSGYADLLDHPVEMAAFRHVAFEAGGATHDVAVSGRADFDDARLARDLARICQWQCDLFGGAPGSRAPFDRY